MHISLCPRRVILGGEEGVVSLEIVILGIKLFQGDQRVFER